MMNTVMYGTKILSFVNTMSAGLIIKTLTVTTRSIYDMIRYISSSNEPKLQEVIGDIKQLDIEFSVSVIENFIKEYEHENLSDAIKRAMLGVNESLEVINEQLISIKELIHEHNSKYFSSWRSIDCSENMSKIKDAKHILNSRYKILMTLMMIFN